ncbi:Hypothetical protein c4656 [Escherichia coli CFT073]|uniref:Uncharacterized protein n=3 Tax=cellular organisms TaxID=131567 RepID=A0A0H2VCG7_ECOL6|nr:Hypothetical protein c4656 [Escherichia coli CFT073]ABJ03203.1 conserved hypothetical protein [Escherichia coli APEC O1]
MFYIIRIYVNAFQDGSIRVKKSQPVARLAFVLFKPVLHRFFGQLDNAQLRDRFGQFRRRLSVIYVAVRAANVLFSLTFRFHGSRFVEILAANCGVGQNGHVARLHFKNAARQIDKLFVTVLFHDANHTRLNGGEQRCVARVDPQFTFATRYLDFLDQTREHLLLCADDVQVVSHCHITLRLRR